MTDENLNTASVDRYFVALESAQTWTEVDAEGFKEHEQRAGFYPKVRGRVATGGFSGFGIKGQVVSPGQSLPEKFEPQAEEESEDPEEEVFEVEISYTLPEGLYEPSDARDNGERTYRVSTNNRGLGEIMAIMDQEAR